eukprot:c23272_g1_i1 orf=595-1482(+)
MERKYSGLSRITNTKAARAEGDSGPPPFHGLHVARQGKYSIEKSSFEAQQPGVHSKDSATRGTVVQELSGRSVEEKEIGTSESVRGKDTKVLQHQGLSEMLNSVASSSRQTADLEEMNVPHESFGKPKDVDVRQDAIKAALALGVETAPLQNRAAAQKLLEKRTDFYSKNDGGRRGRGGRGRGRRGGREQEEATLTLDEWEARRGASNLSSNQIGSAYVDKANTYNDEALAQMLHYQLNVESTGHATAGEAAGEAERIRLSMFSFGGDRGENDDSGRGRHGGRGRGRGRGRRRGR